MKSDPEKAVEVKAQITALSKELAALRKEVILCDSIAERSGVIPEKIKAAREDEQPERKAKCDRTEQRKPSGDRRVTQNSQANFLSTKEMIKYVQFR